MADVNWEEKASNALDAITAKLGIGIDHFWPLFVKQQVTEGIIDLLIICLVSMTIAIGIFLCRKFLKERLEESMMDVGMFSLIPLLLLTLFFAATIKGNPITKIFNPEYHALKEIMEMVK